MLQHGQRTPGCECSECTTMDLEEMNRLALKNLAQGKAMEEAARRVRFLTKVPRTLDELGSGTVSTGTYSGTKFTVLWGVDTAWSGNPYKFSLALEGATLHPLRERGGITSLAKMMAAARMEAVKQVREMRKNFG